MSLYGLDIIIDKKGKYHLSEINGVCSGMSGFKDVYGDDRVKEKVYALLKEKYGNLSINNGTYRRNKFKKEHPFLFAKDFLLSKIPAIDKTYSSLKIPGFLFSEKSEIEWILDTAPNSKNFEFPFEVYNGQKSIVWNILNEELSHPTINDYVSEEITRNKFLQYQILKNSELKEFLPKSALAGMGFTDEATLEGIIDENSYFVIKPILGNCGKGVKFLSRDEAKKYRDTRGSIDSPYPFDLIRAINNKKPKIKYAEDLIEENNFLFELGLSIIQPFIDSKKLDEKGNDIYSVVRAIVCNGNFVDAYLRVSRNKNVNLSQDASAIKFEDNHMKNFCEKSVNVFEKQCSKYNNDNFRKNLYEKYIGERGRTSESMRKIDSFGRIMEIFDTYIGNLPILLR